jgi:hypothetical protein
MNLLRALTTELGLLDKSKFKNLDPDTQEKYAKWVQSQRDAMAKPRESMTGQTLEDRGKLGQIVVKERGQTNEQSRDHASLSVPIIAESRDLDSVRSRAEYAANLRAKTAAIQAIQGKPYGDLMQAEILDDAAGRREMIEYWKGRDAQANTQNMLANLVRGAGTIGILLS